MLPQSHPQQNNKMQELYELIRERFQRVRQLCDIDASSEEYRELREQQKIRCEKEAWILSMFRGKKNNLGGAVKNSYFYKSYLIMQVIDPNFGYDVEPQLTEETFLNDFVCLFTHFFDQYESKFNFKVKIRNLLRPTNHNIVNDMIKYLSDFSRDYSQHIYFWKLKNLRKVVPEEQLKSPPQEPQLLPSALPKMRVSQEKITLPPPSSSQSSKNPEKKKEREEVQNEQQPINKQKQFQRIYGILDIQAFSNFVLSDKSKSHIDLLKLKFNQFYRDLKFRNNHIKKSQTDYSNDWSRNNNQALGTKIQSSCDEISSLIPIKIALCFEKNGFSCLNVLSNDGKSVSIREGRELSPFKDRAKVSSLSNRDVVHSQQLRGSRSINTGQFMLNSLKVLRVSQNFLPPLINAPMKTSESCLRQGTTNPCSQRAPINLENTMKGPQAQGEMQILLKRDGMIYYNQELARESERRKIQKKRISEMRKHFTSEEKIKNTRKCMNDPEEKIVLWLDKINMMKQIERRKIMGLN